MSNPIPALKSLDAFALLSTAHEGVSQAILQAAYLERPLIATPVGGLAEVCIDGLTGLQVAPKDPKAVAAAVLRLMDSPEKCRLLGKNARELVLKQFTLQHTLDEMEEVYQKVLIHYQV